MSNDLGAELTATARNIGAKNPRNCNCSLSDMMMAVTNGNMNSDMYSLSLMEHIMFFLKSALIYMMMLGILIIINSGI